MAVICDATCPERGLRLALQVMSLTRRVVICMNLTDEAERIGISIDIDSLSKDLGIPLIGTAAARTMTSFLPSRL